MSSARKKLFGIVAAIVAVGVLIGFYMTDVLMSGPKAFHPVPRPGRA